MKLLLNFDNKSNIKHNSTDKIEESTCLLIMLIEILSKMRRKKYQKIEPCIPKTINPIKAIMNGPRIELKTSNSPTLTEYTPSIKEIIDAKNNNDITIELSIFKYSFIINYGEISESVKKVK